MEMVELGRTGLTVSRLGIGLFPMGHLTQDKIKTAGQVLGAALDAGVNFFDTAECYGDSEEMIGKAVGHRRDEIVLATKAGHVSTGSSGQPWTAQAVREGIDRSLARLNTDHVDLLQVHAYDILGPPPDDVIEAVLEAKEAGKTRFIGYSAENEDADWAIQTGLFATLQTSFSLVDQRARHGLLELAKSRGVGFIAKRPIANAVWGKASSQGDAGLSGRFLERLERARAMLELGPIVGAPEDPTVLALGFVLAHQDVHTAIVGTGSPEHMLANIDAVERSLPIPEGVVSELHRRFDLVGKNWRGIDT